MANHARLHASPASCKCQALGKGAPASPDADEIETLYLDGTTAHGKPAGHRFPTDSGKLSFGRQAG